MKNGFFILLPFLFCSPAFAVTVCEQIRSRIPDAQAELRYQNCEKIFANKLIPNEKAAKFTLDYFQANFGKLVDSSCVQFPEPGPKGAPGAKINGEESLSKAVIDAGIHNSCFLAINDLESKYPEGALRTQGYTIDLCATNDADLVRNIFFNKGTGSRNKSYRDVNDAHTSLIGAFLTAPETFDFTPYKMTAKYREVQDWNRKNRAEDQIVGLRLVGLNSSNNDSYQSKPMHQSAYQSSWGCPSVSPENVWVLEKLAQNGPALLMNYGPDVYHQSATTCVNDQVATNATGQKKGVN